MTTKLPEGFKERLIAEGRYADFRRRQSDLKAMGMKPSEVRRRIQEEFAPVGAASGGEGAAGAVASGGVGVEVLAGRKCSMSEAFSWAFTRAQLGDGRMEEAPSDYAWALHQLFLESPSAKVDLARQALAKLIAKDDPGPDRGDEIDGQAEYDILAELGEDRR